MVTATEFRKMFSFPDTPQTSIGPNQFYEYEVPSGKKVVITDVYIENHDNEASMVSIAEQSEATSFEIRYSFRTLPGQTTVVNLATGFKLGDRAHIAGAIRIINQSARARVLARANGIIVG